MHKPPVMTLLDLAPLDVLCAVLEQDIAQQKLPGAVLMVARHGQVVLHQNLGKLCPLRGDPMPLNALFRIYSMTKPIVSVAALMLVEQGRLQLDQAVADHLPALAQLKVLNSQGVHEPIERAITVADLLCHTAGFTYDFAGKTAVHRQYVAAKLFNRRRTPTEFIDALAALPLLHPPGTHWAYSHATDVLGCLIEVVSQQTLGDFLQQQIFNPLGMRDTAFHVPSDHHHRIAEPFANDPDTGSPVHVFDVRKPAAHDMGGAGLVSSAADFARFMQMLLSQGQSDGIRLLRQETVQAMTQNQLAGRPISGPLLAPDHGFGHGVAVRLKATAASGAGSVGAYHWAGLAGTSFFIDPALGLHAQILIQQPGRREHYQNVFRDHVYAAINT
jgi:CubicO group peptidase (beta-lactamase class C family)